MADPWTVWDERIKQTGRPSRLAESLTDVEILNLLASEQAGPRPVEKRVLKDELLARLEASRRRAPPEEDRAPQAPAGYTDPASGVVPTHGEPMKGSYGPNATSALPSKDADAKWR